jgi:hypothetical protein
LFSRQINDGFCGGHAIERNVIFDWVRETQDHGPINTWDRSLYVNGDGSPKQGWIRVTHNAIFNGPSDDRDLGNLYPAIDNDDGSQLYWNAYNVAICESIEANPDGPQPHQRALTETATLRAHRDPRNKPSRAAPRAHRDPRDNPPRRRPPRAAPRRRGI